MGNRAARGNAAFDSAYALEMSAQRIAMMGRAAMTKNGTLSTGTGIMSTSVTAIGGCGGS